MSECFKTYPVVRRCDVLPKFEQCYSDIVRDDDFKRVQEDIRHNDLIQDTGAVANSYDYKDGVVPKDDPVTDLILMLRSGKMDKADVQKVREQLEEISKSESDKYTAEQKALADRALAEQRQKYLDDKTGFKPDLPSDKI